MVKEENKPTKEQTPEAKVEAKVDAEAKIEAKPEKAKQVEDSRPKFRNNGKDVKIRLGSRSETAWITVKHAEVVQIPRKLALANKLEEVK